MWIIAGNTLLNMDKIKTLSIDPDGMSGKICMRLHAFVDGIEEPITLAITPFVGDDRYNGELAALKSYVKAIHRGLEEGWTTYELGQPVPNLSPGGEMDFTAHMGVITKTIELARVRHDALKANDGLKADVERRKLDAYIENLTHEQRDVILALCWFGRGDFKQYASALKNTTTIPSGDIAGYLSDKFPLDEYLTAGIERKSEAV